MLKALLAVPLVLAGGVVACTPAVPAKPTYDNDVRPIFVAHCVRCHGADDMLHAMVVNGILRPPRACYLQRYETTGDCTTTPIDPAVCKNGAGSEVCRGLIPSYIRGMGTVPMPPPPSDPLTDWEIEVITRWTAAGAPQ